MTTEAEWYERTEELLHSSPREESTVVLERALAAYQILFPGSKRTKAEVRDILDGLFLKLQGFPPRHLVLVANEAPVETADDLWMEPAYNDVEVQRLWDIHDGRGLGTMVVAVYSWDPDAVQWKRDHTYGMLGRPAAVHRADPENAEDRLS